MSARPAALTGFALLHKRVAYLLAALGLAGLGLGSEVDRPTMILLGLAYAATWFVEGPILLRPRWERGMTLALVVGLTVQLARGLSGEPWLPLGLGFTGLLQVSRLASRRSAREHVQIALLAFIHLAAATVLTTELAYGALFLGFVIVLPWMLALTQLRAEIEAEHHARSLEARALEARLEEGEPRTLPPTLGGGVEHAELARVLGSRRLVGARFLAGTTLLSLPLFACTALLFVLFPRVGLGMLAFGRGEGAAIAGFGDAVELGQVGRIRDDATVILRVIPGGLGPHPPRELGLYLRGSAFDHYDGRRWSRASAPAIEPIAVERDEYILSEAIRRGQDRPYRIELAPLEEPVIFLPDHTVALEIPPHIEAGLERPRRIELRAGVDVRALDPDGAARSYTAWTRPRARSVFDTPPDAASLEVPPGHERLARLARAWTEGARSDRERAERVVDHLGRPPFRYSLVMHDPGAAAPLEHFLFETREGHCEYFASAMAILLRTLGVPTRNVTGFLGGTWNEYGRYYAVRSGDAHSWVEVYLEGEGWVRFDPTPASARALGLGASLSLRARDALDALVAWWERDVVSFDLRTQRGLARDVFSLLRTPHASSRPLEEAERSGARGARSGVGRSLFALALAALLALALAALVRRLARLRSAPAGSSEARRLVALYRRLERVLAGRGRPRPPARTPSEHAALLEAEGFEGADVVLRVTRRYNEARFGPLPMSEAELDELERAVRALGHPR